MEHRLQDWLEVTSGNFLGDSVIAGLAHTSVVTQRSWVPGSAAGAARSSTS
jgi:hypothetical protein